MVSLAIDVEGIYSLFDLLPSDIEADGVGFVSGIAAACVASSPAFFFVCFFFFFEADGTGCVVPTFSGIAAARVASNSASSSRARLRHASHSSDTGLEAEQQR